MTKTFSASGEDLEKYAFDLFKPQDDILLEIIQRAAKAGLPAIHVSPMDGLHLEVITRAIDTKKAVEIGTLAGYSGVCIARGLAEGGMLYTLEYSPDHAKVAEESFKKAK